MVLNSRTAHYGPGSAEVIRTFIGEKKCAHLAKSRARTRRWHSQREPVLEINISSKQRLKVLRYLDGINLNAYSLFGREESLMDTMAVRELDLS